MQITALKNLNLNIRRAKLGKSSGNVNSFFITEVGLVVCIRQLCCAVAFLVAGQTQCCQSTRYLLNQLISADPCILYRPTLVKRL
jgi:hypothetical protein